MHWQDVILQVRVVIREKWFLLRINWFLKNQSYLEEFAAFGDVPTVSDEQLEWVQAFVCDLYGHKDKDVNFLRYKLYSSRQGN